MHKIKFACALLGVVGLFTTYAQFMDPERSSTQSNGAIIQKVDEFFPVIIPDHSSGDTTVIKKEVGIISNKVEQLDIKVTAVSNEVDVVKATTLKSDRVTLTNNVEFVSAVRTIADAGTYPVEEFNQMKASIAKYRVAFSNISEVVVSEETSIEELKAAIQVIKNASSAIVNQP